MPEFAGPQGLFLIGVVCAFGAFAVTLGAMTLYVKALPHPGKR